MALFACFVLLWQQAGAEETRFEEVAQNKSAAGTVIGSHPILKSDAVDLEFKVDPLNASRNPASGLDTLHNNLGVIYNYQFSRQAKLSQEYMIGFKTQQDSLDQSYLADSGNTLDQRHVTRLTFAPASKLNWRFTNELRSELRSDHSSPSDVWRYGSGLDWQMFSLTRLQPDVSVETHSDTASQVWTRKEYGVNLRQDILKNSLSLNVRPSGRFDEQDWSGGRDTRMLKLESALAWKPADHTSLNCGNRIEEVDALNQYYAESASTYFAEWVQSPYRDLNLRVRTEYELREFYDGVNNPVHDTFRLVTGPRWNLDDGLSAGAEFRYSYETRTDYSQAKEDKVLSLSLSRSF